ncbi:hypothetical protein C0993_006068 [Termitomyces sp. T159_Od127]|nr:hypothetical protein C0993_006068 [Termitomyces sp. T159_Od127]
MPEYRYRTEPYTYFGLPFDNLPQHAQSFLRHHGLSPNTYDPITVAEVRVQRGRKLGQDLLGPFKELVQKRREVAALVDAFKKLDTRSPEYKIAEHDYVGIARYLDKGPLPKMSGYFDDYVDDIDALVWLEFNGRQDASFERIQEYRDAKVHETIEGAVECLYHMDAEAVHKDLESSEVGKRSGASCDNQDCLRHDVRLY